MMTEPTSPPPPVIWMTPEQLYQWRMEMKLSKREAAAKLGLARNTIRAYESGKHVIPRYVALAIVALTIWNGSEQAAA